MLRSTGKAAYPGECNFSIGFLRCCQRSLRLGESPMMRCWVQTGHNRWFSRSPHLGSFVCRFSAANRSNVDIVGTKGRGVGVVNLPISIRFESRTSLNRWTHQGATLSGSRRIHTTASIRFEWHSLVAGTRAVRLRGQDRYGERNDVA